MIHRIVCLLLIPTILLIQSVSLGHQHAGTQPAGHNDNPHFHLSSLSGHHHHNHGSDGHHHHHNDDEDNSSEPDRQQPQPEPLSDHDSDAIHIACFDALAYIKGHSVLDNTLTTLAFLTVFGLAQFSTFQTESAHLATRAHPPFSPRCSCPLYVRHLTLLI